MIFHICLSIILISSFSNWMRNRYGEVYWTMMDSVPLKKQLVERFKDKTMAVIGYETDQVFYKCIRI